MDTDFTNNFLSWVRHINIFDSLSVAARYQLLGDQAILVIG